VNILHLTPFLQGGAGRVVVGLASEQKRQGHDVTVVTSRTNVPGYEHYGDLIARLAHAGVTVWQVDSLFHRDYAANLRAVELLNRLARLSPPDLIHTHAAVPSLVALLASGHARRSPGLVQTMHGWGVAKTAEQADCDVRVMNLVDRVVVPSEDAARLLTGLGVDSSHVHVIGYGVGHDDSTLDSGDTVLAAELVARRRRGTFVLCCIGTIGVRKNQALLVEALSELDVRDDVFTVFIGDGDTVGLTAYARRAGVDARVVVRGYTPAARALARHADAVVLPSRNEGQPLTALEAFADRVLMIASDSPALSEMIRDGRTGLLHRNDDAASLAAAIRRARALPRQTRAAIVERAAAHHAAHATLDGMCRNYMGVYHFALRGPAAWRRAS
jgi:glycosyltransferase involved in cell wall biosynthesis